MGSETVGTLVVTAVLVAVLALFLLLIGLGLQRLSFTLGTIVVGLRAIRLQTQPVGDVLGGVLEDVTRIDSDLGDVAEIVGQEMAGTPAVSPGPVATAADGQDEYDEYEEYEDEYDEAFEDEAPRLQLNIRAQTRVPARR